MSTTTFVLSDGTSCNSHGFRILLQGMDLSRFERNPIMLYNHKMDQPIGCWKNLRIENNRLLADADFDREDTIGREVARKVEQGYLRGVSVGIYIRNMITDEKGTTATETELLEASIVSVPSDAAAVRLYDENNMPTTFDKVRLSFNLNQQHNMKEKHFLTEATLIMLAISGEPSAEAVELAVKAKNDRIAELEQTIAREQKQRVENLVNSAVSEKKITSAERDAYIALAEKDYDNVAKILASMPSATRVVEELNLQGTASKYNGKTWDELDRAGLLASLKAEAPELYERLYKQKFNV